MGRKTYVPYGLYRTHGFISAPLAAQTGFSEQDLELFWEALMKMFEPDRSASCGEMAAQKLIAFKLESELGNAPAHKLFDLVRVANKDESKPSRTFSDYDVVIDRSALPSGVELMELI